MFVFVAVCNENKRGTNEDNIQNLIVFGRLSQVIVLIFLVLHDYMKKYCRVLSCYKKGT